MVRYVGHPGREHQEFTEWAKAQGVEINGVRATRCSGQGIGITACRNIEAGEVLVSVPISAVLTSEVIPHAFREKFSSSISSQGLIAAYLCCDEEAQRKYAPWRNVWPSMAELEESVPLLWPQYLTGGEREWDTPLPPSLSGVWSSMYTTPKISIPTTRGRNILAKQARRLSDAYAAACTAFPEADWDMFIYYWVVVNTRSFFDVPPRISPSEEEHDDLALCPFADYFNHSNEGCEVICGPYEYVFKAARAYEPGEQIFVTYGRHSTDILWTEYGFMPKDNEWDSLSLDDIIFNGLGRERVQLIKETDYFGNFHFTRTGPCLRTEVAATLIYLNADDWKQYILGHRPPRFDQWRTSAIAARWIRRYIEEAKASLLNITELRARLDDLGDDKRFHVIILRWRLIIELAHEALTSMMART